MVNIGLALKELWSVREAGASVVNLNVLPTAYQPKPISWVKVVAVPIAIAAVAGIVPLLTLVQSGYANVTSIRDQLDMTNQLLIEKQLERQELMNSIAELEEKVAEAEASRDNFTTALDSLDKQGSGVDDNLHIATSALPDTISLASISHTESILTISCTSPSEVEVLQYAQSLDDSGRFAEIIIAGIRKIEDESTEGEGVENESMDFTLILKIRG